MADAAYKLAAKAAFDNYVTRTEYFADRPGKYFAEKTREKVAKLDDIIDLIKPGDAGWFAGRKPHSLLIRIATVSNVSHGFNFDRDETGVYVVESLEGIGIRRMPIRDYLESIRSSWPIWRGTTYWAPVDRYRYYDFDGEAAMAFAREYVPGPNGESPKRGTGKYGRSSVLYESLFHIPFVRIIAYWRWHGRLDQAWRDVQPYCSMFQKLIGIAGGEDPVPGIAPQWCAPINTWTSKLWAPEKIAIEL
jgi:hypothetical protein